MDNISSADREYLLHTTEVYYCNDCIYCEVDTEDNEWCESVEPGSQEFWALQVKPDARRCPGFERYEDRSGR